MTPHRTVILDFDMVIADLHTEWLRRYNLLMGTAHRPEDITTWEWPGTVENPELMWEILKYPDLYLKVNPLPGAVEGVHTLTALGVPWVICSSLSNVDQLRAKWDWLVRHDLVRAGADFTDHLLPVRKKYLIQGAVMVDDYHGNLAHFPGKRILFDAPHNRSILGGNMHRAKDWTEVVSMILTTWPSLEGFLEQNRVAAGA